MNSLPPEIPRPGDDESQTVYAPTNRGHLRTLELVVAVMVSAQGVGLIALIGLFAPDHPWLAIVVLGFVVAIEGLATTRFLSTRTLGEVDRTLYRLAEIVTILVAIRFTLWIATGTVPPLIEVGREFGDFTTLVFDLSFVLSSMVIGYVWLRAITFGAYLRDLAIGAEEADLFALYANNRDGYPAGAPLERNRGALARQLTASWAWGGVVLVICSVLTTFDYPALETGSVQFTGGSVKPLLWSAITLYVMTGLWLVSWCRQLALSARWMLLGAKRSPRLEQRWLRGALFVLLGVAGLALFLPAGAVAPIAYLLNALLIGIAVAANWMLLAFARVIGLLYGLFGTPPPGVLDSLAPESVYQNLPPPSSFIQAENTFILPDLGWLWWACLAAIVASSVAYFFGERWLDWPQALRRLGHRLFGWLTTRAPAKPQTTAAQTTSRVSIPTDELPVDNARRKWSLFGLAPKDQVKNVYLRLLTHTARRGVVRKPGDTAGEFLTQMVTRWPAANPDFTELTARFHKARYSLQPVDATDVRISKRVYRALRRMIRH